MFLMDQSRTGKWYGISQEVERVKDQKSESIRSSGLHIMCPQEQVRTIRVY